MPTTGIKICHLQEFESDNCWNFNFLVSQYLGHFNASFHNKIFANVKKRIVKTYRNCDKTHVRSLSQL